MDAELAASGNWIGVAVGCLCAPAARRFMNKELGLATAVVCVLILFTYGRDFRSVLLLQLTDI